MTTKTTTRSRKTTKVEEPVQEEAVVEEESTFDIFLKHQRNAIVETGKALEGMLPAAVREHGQAAFREMIEGYRGLFNAAIDEVIEAFEKVKRDAADN